MKKLFTTLALFAALALTACGNTNGESKKESVHVHTFNEAVWEKNETQHWHPATCEHSGQKGSAANHDFEEVTAEYVAPQCSAPGKKVEQCKACGYKKETVLTAEHDLQPIEHEQAEGEVKETISKCSKDNYYQIKFDAFDAAATVSTSSDKHTSYVKLSKQGDNASTIEFKIWSPVAMKGRFWLNITGNGTNLYDRATDSGSQSIFYTFEDTTTGINTWKNEVKVNDQVVDFDNAKYNLNGEEIEFAKLMYSDFGELSTSTTGDPIEVPMPEVNLVEGVNTLKLTRLTGYAFNMHQTTFKASI